MKNTVLSRSTASVIRANRQVADPQSLADLDDFAELPSANGRAALVPPATPYVPPVNRFTDKSIPKPSKENRMSFDRIEKNYLAKALDKRLEVLPPGVAGKFRDTLTTIQFRIIEAQKRNPGNVQNTLVDAAIDCCKIDALTGMTFLKNLMADVTFAVFMDCKSEERRSTPGDAEIEAARGLRDGAASQERDRQQYEGGDGIGFDPTTSADSPRLDAVHDEGREPYEGGEPKEEVPSAEEAQLALLRIQAFVGVLASKLIPKPESQAYWGIDGLFPLMQDKVVMPDGVVEWIPIRDYAAAARKLDHDYRTRDARAIAKAEANNEFDALRTA